MLRHTTHLATTLRPSQRRKQATRSAELHAKVVPACTNAATLYPARERAAGGPQDNAYYRCSCGCAFVAHVEAGVHCPHCDDEQTW